MEKAMIIFITKKIFARARRNDGTDNGCVPLSPGQYEANKTNDGALEILQGSNEPLYLLPFIWWERMEMGEIVIS
jgi:hypothetical protein